MFQEILQLVTDGEENIKYYTDLFETNNPDKKILTTEKPIQFLIGIWNYNNSLTAFYYDVNKNPNKWYRRVGTETIFSEKNFNVPSDIPQGLYSVSEDRKTITFYTYNNDVNPTIITLE